MKTANELAVIKRIEGVIEERGMTKKEFCEKLGISQQKFSNWTTEKDNSSNNAGFMNMITQIAEVLDCPLDYLLRGKVEIPHETDIYLVELIDRFNRCDVRGRLRILEVAKEEQERYESERKKSEGGTSISHAG